MTFKTVLSILSSASIIFPVIAGVMVRKNMSSKIKGFYYFILLTLPFEIAFYTTAISGINNLPIFNLFNLFEFIFLFYIIIKWIFPSMASWKLVLFLLLIFTWWIWNMITFGIKSMGGYMLISENITLLFLSSIFLISLIKNDDTYPLNDSRFWIAVSIFIYFTSTTIIFTYAEDILKDPSSLMVKHYIYFHALVNISCNIIYTIGFLCEKRKT
jgi:hypothetical protein